MATLFFSLGPLPADEQRPSSESKQNQAPLTYNLFKFHYDRVGRTTFKLDTQLTAKNGEVLVWLDLRKDGQGIGRMRLDRVNMPGEDSWQYAVSCLVDDYVPDSRLHISVREKDSEKRIGGIILPLKEARIRSSYE